MANPLLILIALKSAIWLLHITYKQAHTFYHAVKLAWGVEVSLRIAFVYRNVFFKLLVLLIFVFLLWIVLVCCAVSLCILAVYPAWLAVALEKKKCFWQLCDMQVFWCMIGVLWIFNKICMSSQPSLRRPKFKILLKFWSS